MGQQYLPSRRRACTVLPVTGQNLSTLVDQSVPHGLGGIAEDATERCNSQSRDAGVSRSSEDPELSPWKPAARRATLTVFGEVVDDGVRLAVAIEVSQLGAAVHRHVVYAQTPLAAAAGVQDGALLDRRQAPPSRTRPHKPELQVSTHLHQSACLLAQLVVVLELHGDGLVAVQARQLHVCGVVHEEGAQEICGPDT